MDKQNDFLKVPIYLNQQLIFDWIAVIEDGFSHLSSIKRTSSDKENHESEIEGKIGLSNTFSFLSASFSGKRKKGDETSEQTEVSQEKIHTPNSLFSKLYKSLSQNNMINDGTKELNIDQIKTGDFYLCNAILRKNPIESTFESFLQLLEFTKMFQDDKNQKKEMDKITIQMKSIITQIKNNEKVEILGEDINIPEIKYILSAHTNYFLNNDASEVNDGNYYILGKVVKVIKSDSDETINLLRKTALGSVTVQTIEQMLSGFKDLESSGIKNPEIVTEISGPCIQIYPVAIFV